MAEHDDESCPYAIALRGLYGFIESGSLMRNIEHDHKPGWALRELPLVYCLARVRELLGLR